MNKKTGWIIFGLLTLCLSLASSANAADPTYGARGAASPSNKTPTIEQMLTYAIEDEFLARGEYQKIMDTFGTRRPFSNIIHAEERHIALLKPLFEKYNVSLPPDRGAELAEIPKDFSETFPIGVAAEIANIQMYKHFLTQQLPADIRDIFEILQSGSENHLRAFQRGGGTNR